MYIFCIIVGRLWLAINNKYTSTNSVVADNSVPYVLSKSGGGGYTFTTGQRKPISEASAHKKYHLIVFTPIISFANLFDLNKCSFQNEKPSFMKSFLRLIK